MATIAPVSADDLDELVPLVAGYLEFYAVPRPAAEIRAYCAALLENPEHDGVQLLARDDAGTASGFATVYWTWATTRLGRQAVMNDLFVAPSHRGSGTADALIAASLELARAHGAVVLEWVTALENHRAQKVYDRVGGQPSRWITYELPC